MADESHPAPSRNTRALFTIIQNGPVTAREVAELWGEPGKRAEWGTACYRLWSYGFVTRRKRGETGTMRQSPFEYTIRVLPPDWDAEVFGD